MHNFWLKNIPGRGEAATLDGAEKNHAVRILRLRDGDTVGLLSGDGVRAQAVLTDARSGTLEVTERTFAERERPLLSVWCAAPKRNKLDILLKQAAELGVASIRFLDCRYSVARPENFARMNALLIEGCKQSGCAYLPELQELTAIEKLPLLAGELHGKRLFFGEARPEVGSAGLPDAGELRSAEELVWIVGPEGGFAPEETDLLKSVGAQGVHLGGNIMRLETAAAAGIAVLRCLSMR